MTKLRIAFVALTVGGGMGQLTWATSHALSNACEIRLLVPQHFPFRDDRISVAHIPVASRKPLRPLSMLNPRTHRSLIKQVSAFNPDVVHIFNSEGYPWNISLALWCNWKRIPVILTIHDPVPHPGSVPDWLNEKLGRITASRATAIHLFHPASREAIEHRYRKPVGLADYVSISHVFTAHKSRHIAKENSVLLFGRLEHYKGIDTLIAAADFLPPDIKIIIAGPGRLGVRQKAAIRHKLQHFELHERYLDEAEVAQLFERARVQVLPYKEVTQSQLPKIAADFGVITVAPNIGSFRDEIPRHGGLLVQPRDPSALADGIVRALHQPPTQPQPGSMEIVSEHYIELYRKTINIKHTKVIELTGAPRLS
ncbi:MAG: glycosyltransferase [Alphaproteobacteria bacterium]|nr:glycosyltransferase [Alphaproteobacteria bacterium]